MRNPNRFFLLAGLLAFFAPGAQADISVDWTFDDPAGTLLSNTVNSGTENWTNWDADIGQSATTGDGVFRIQRAVGGGQNGFAWLTTPEVAWLVVDLDGWAFSDKSGGGYHEDIRFGFSHNGDPINQYAEISLGRRASPNEVFIQGIAELRSQGAKWIAPISTGLSNIQDRPVRLVLKVDRSSSEPTYSIYFNIDEVGYVHVGTGELDSGRSPFMLRFHALNSFADKLDPEDPNSAVEFVDVSRIFVTSEDPIGDDLIPTPVPEMPEERITHNWEFNEPEGTTFSGTINSLGDQTWTTHSESAEDDIGDSFATGDGAFRIRRALGGPMTNLLYLDRQWAGKQWLVVDFRGWNMIGIASERIQFGFIDDFSSSSASTLAEVRLRRIADDPDHVQMMGRAFPSINGATLTAEQPIFSAQQNEPVRIVLEYDTQANSYTIHYRIAEGAYNLFGEGETDYSYGANALRFYATNNFAEDGAFVDIERMFLTNLNPLTEPEVPEGSYAAWVAEHFPEGGADAQPTADSDGDGLSNLLEYAFASNPRAAGRENTPTVSGNGEHLKINFRRNTSADDLTYLVEASADLDAWTPIASAEGTGPFVAAGSSGIEVVSDDGFETVIVADSEMIDGKSRRFLRLQVGEKATE